MKILVVCCIHKRYILTDIVFAYYKNLQREGLDIELLACGTTGDYLSEKNAAMNGWNYTSFSNVPLAQKHNHLFKEARKIPHDAIMLIGSDDLISKQVFDFYNQIASAESRQMFGFNMLWFYSPLDKKLIFFKGYKNDHTHRMTMGAGRLFPKWVLEKMNYNLWDESKLNRGLDSVTSTYLKHAGIEEIECKLKDIEGGMILDIKTDINITDFDRVLANCEDDYMSKIELAFPEEITKINKWYEYKIQRREEGAIDNDNSDPRDMGFNSVSYNVK